MNVVVKKPEELNSVINLSANYQDHHFSYSQKDIEDFKRKMQEPNAYLAINKDHQNNILGFIASSETIFPRYLFISELLVDQKAQGQGIGQSLVQTTIKFAKSHNLKGVYTETESWNIPAQKFYEQCGFKVVDNPNWTEGLTMRIQL